MTAKEKIEQLRDGWYGFDVFSAIVGVLLNGLGFFKLASAFIGLLISLMITWFLGKRLLARSSLTRVVLLVFAVLGTVFGTLALLKLASLFFTAWSLKYLAATALGVAGLYMNVRSIRVLRDRSVRAFFH